MKDNTVLITDLSDVKLLKRGKVRDIYDLEDSLLIVSTDRISCFDVVLPTGVPNKGIVLNKLSVFWFNFTKDIIDNHLITDDVDRFPKELHPFKKILNGRSMLARKAIPIPVECVVRGYLAGSAWDEYKETQSACGIKLQNGLSKYSKLPEPIFTPATKEDTGHDINVSYEYIIDNFGLKIAESLKDKSIKLYNKASEFAEQKGIIIADTKFEFGFINNDIILIDEIFTPDSSRFWSKKDYLQDLAPENFDKQFVRDYLEALGWNKTPPAPELPDYIVKKTSEKYMQILNYILE
jgi:phosphoribosylaminoimidazole-succinocarboxamide synthase